MYNITMWDYRLLLKGCFPVKYKIQPEQAVVNKVYRGSQGCPLIQV